jgi:hypothetical protein
LKGPDIWKAHKYVKPQSRQQLIPPLKKSDGSLTQTDQEKLDRLREGLFPSVPESLMSVPEKATDTNWPRLKADEIQDALKYIASDKAPGPDGIKTRAIKEAWKVARFRKAYRHLLNSCVRKGYHPQRWRTSNTVILAKPGKKDYSEVKAYRPISLLNTMGKILEKIIQRRLTYLTQDILPNTQFGAREGYSATDAVLKIIQDARKASETTTAMMIDVKGAFDNVHKETLIETLKSFNVPSAAVRWVYYFLTDRHASLIVDGKQEESKRISTGIPQGSPVSPLLFSLYTTPLYKVIEDMGATALGFVDDITVYVQGHPNDNTAKLEAILQACVTWAEEHYTGIDLGDKLGFMHFIKGKPDESEWEPLRLPGGDSREPQDEVKLLGITLDKALSFKPHMREVERKSMGAMNQMWRLGGCFQGISGTAMRQMYLACVRPIIEYGSEIWYPTTTQKQRKSLQVIQNRGLRRILGAIKTTPANVMHVEAGVMPLEIRMSKVMRDKMLRIKHSINPNNPITEEVRANTRGTPINRLTETLDEAVDGRQPTNQPPTKPPWKPPDETDTTEAANARGELNKDRAVIQKAAIDTWQLVYETDFKGESYRKIAGKVKCSVKLNQLPLRKILREKPRGVLSKITQYRTNHALVGAWYQRFKVQNTEHNCSCGELESVKHILTECPNTEEERKILKAVSPEMDDRKLLGTIKGLDAVAEFISAVRSRQE